MQLPLVNKLIERTVAELEQEEQLRTRVARLQLVDGALSLSRWISEIALV